MRLDHRVGWVFVFAIAAAMVVVAGGVVRYRASRGPAGVAIAAPEHDPGSGSVKRVTIDLDKALAVKLPEVHGQLKPGSFQTPDGRTGWVISIPGGRPISTPAYSDGMLFLGGGYGSHEFYAFNAPT
jgi:hypothetical protein